MVLKAAFDSLECNAGPGPSHLAGNPKNVRFPDAS